MGASVTRWLYYYFYFFNILPFRTMKNLPKSIKIAKAGLQFSQILNVYTRNSNIFLEFCLSAEIKSNLVTLAGLVWHTGRILRAHAPLPLNRPRPLGAMLQNLFYPYTNVINLRLHFDVSFEVLIEFWLGHICTSYTYIGLEPFQLGSSISCHPQTHWQKSFATFGPGSSLRHLVANWKKYPSKIHWQKGYLGLAMAVRLGWVWLY